MHAACRCARRGLRRRAGARRSDARCWVARGVKHSSWFIVPGLLLALLGEQVWQLRAERAALTQAHQRIQIGDTAEQACLVLQAVQLFTVLPNAQDRCAHMGLTGTTFSGNWHLLIRIENQRVVGKAIRDFDNWTLPRSAPPDAGQVESPKRCGLTCD